MTQTSANDADAIQERTCLHCGAALPQDAAFCNACGERLDKAGSLSSLIKSEEHVTKRYRITSLIRRRPFVNLYFAQDQQLNAQVGLSRVVAMRDLDLTELDDAALVKGLDIVQQEYDLLRRLDIPSVMQAIDLRYHRGHVSVIAAFVHARSNGSSGERIPQYEPRLSTLQDFLQSGQGLPPQQRALRWIMHLCAGVELLHRNHVVIGDLDPQAILLAGNTADTARVQPVLMISWLPASLRDLLPQSTTSTLSYFIAPEAIQGQADARSDVYSLGAILYVLLTGMPPAESTRRSRGRLRAPLDIDGRISIHASEAVMQSLAMNPANRFQSVESFAAALSNPQYRAPKLVQEDDQAAGTDDSETVRIIPLSLKDVARWRAARSKSAGHNHIPQRPTVAHAPAISAEESHVVESDWQQARHEPQTSAPLVTLPVTPALALVPMSPAPSIDDDLADEEIEAPSSQALSLAASSASSPSSPGSHGWLQRLTGMLPSIKAGLLRPVRARPSSQVALLDVDDDAAPPSTSWLSQLKQAVLGLPQQHAIAAAAIIETPLRVLPGQMYTLRINLVGRNETDRSAEEKARGSAAGLSGLTQGDLVMIEVRSVLQESYAYVVQQAAVSVPADGYIAEVTIPMQPLSSTPTGRRDRLHIFFMDEHRHPLYEKPFVVEIFVSHHVKRGGEGHYVLTIPY